VLPATHPAYPLSQYTHTVCDITTVTVQA